MLFTYCKKKKIIIKIKWHTAQRESTHIPTPGLEEGKKKADYQKKLPSEECQPVYKLQVSPHLTDPELQWIRAQPRSQRNPTCFSVVSSGMASLDVALHSQVGLGRGTEIVRKLSTISEISYQAVARRTKNEMTEKQTLSLSPSIKLTDTVPNI